MDPQPADSLDLNEVLRDRAAHLRHMAALTRLIAEHEAEYGAFTEEEKAWARKVFDDADAERERRRAARAAAEGG